MFSYIAAKKIQGKDFNIEIIKFLLSIIMQFAAKQLILIYL